MMRLVSVLGIALAAGQPAVALSCLQPSLPSTFEALNAAEETYVILRGTFTPLPGEPSEPEGGLNDKQPYDVRTEFSGALATLNGFDEAPDLGVTVEVGCAGAWCGGVPEGEVIAFVELRDDSYFLAAGPCPFSAFPVSAETDSQTLSCLRAERCEVEQP